MQGQIEYRRRIREGGGMRGKREDRRWCLGSLWGSWMADGSFGWPWGGFGGLLGGLLGYSTRIGWVFKVFRGVLGKNWGAHS